MRSDHLTKHVRTHVGGLANQRTNANSTPIRAEIVGNLVLQPQQIVGNIKMEMSWRMAKDIGKLDYHNRHFTHFLNKLWLKKKNGMIEKMI